MDPGDSTRPTAVQWLAVGLDSDPTPGDVGGIRILSSRLGGRADDATSSRTQVTNLLSDPSAMTWLGASGEAFWTACEPFPDQLGLMNSSYADAAHALDVYRQAIDSLQQATAAALSSASGAWSQLGVDPAAAVSHGYDSNAFQAKVADIISKGGHEDAHPDAYPTISRARHDIDVATTAFESATRTCTSALEAAAQTAARAVKLNTMTFTERFTASGGRLDDLVFVQHDGPDLDAAATASRDADILAKALQNPDDPWSKFAIQLVGQHLSDHQGDQAYLQTFFGAGGSASIAGVLKLYAPKRGNLSEKADLDNFPGKDIIANYASGVAAASSFADSGLVHLPADVWNPLFDGDMMPGALLFAFGPAGSAWGHTLLASAGTGVLQGGYDRQANQAIWTFEGSILTRISENADACRDLLVPQDGSAEAAARVDANMQKLLDQDWWYPEMAKDGVSAAIIHNATTDLAGHPDESAAATRVLFRNLDGNGLPPNLAMAVSQASAAHLDSLMASADGAVKLAGSSNPHFVPLDLKSLDNVLKSFAADPYAAGNLRGAIGAGVLSSAQGGVGFVDSAVQGSQQWTDFRHYGFVLGRLDLLDKQAGVDAAAATDSAHTNYQSWATAAVGALGSVGPISYQAAMAGSGPVLSPFFEKMWPTHAADDALSSASFALSAGEAKLNVPIVQGLINAGALQPPPGATWFHGGLVDISSSPLAANDFGEWYAKNEGASPARIDDLQYRIAALKAGGGDPAQIVSLQDQVENIKAQIAAHAMNDPLSDGYDHAVKGLALSK
ncbi:hypothetical protein GCM10009838_54290 [Catenulispora subtropica]|uniref:Uncharacterized protein n=2 Tax=Catenulispora subtropica TaxID=450798 RepID=A0ABP5DUR9_9ACTN